VEGNPKYGFFLIFSFLFMEVHWCTIEPSRDWSVFYESALRQISCKSVH
jgi:hypothetical protein